jgi:hypothetical protein
VAAEQRGSLWKKGRNGQKNQDPQVIDSEGEQDYVFLIDGCNNITVGEGSMGAAAELGANAGKTSLDKIGRLMSRVTWQVQWHRRDGSIQGKGAQVSSCWGLEPNGNIGRAAKGWSERRLEGSMRTSNLLWTRQARGARVERRVKRVLLTVLCSTGF